MQPESESVTSDTSTGPWVRRQLGPFAQLLKFPTTLKVR